MNRLSFNTANNEQLEKLLLIISIGVIEGVKKEVLTIEEAENVLFTPYIMDFIQTKKIAPEVLDIVHLGTELEDIDSLIPEKLAACLTDIKQQSIELLEKRAAFQIQHRVISLE